MKRGIGVLIGVLPVIALVAVTAGIGWAGGTDCSTLAQPVTGTVNGGLDVTTGACTLDGATIHGGINMSGGNLEVCNSVVNGNIDADGGTCIGVGVGPDDVGRCSGGNTINGHVEIEDFNAGATTCGNGEGVIVEVDSNTLNGEVTINDNTNAEIEGNDIQGTLKCSGNTTAPINNKAPNNVTGEKKGQCAGLL